MSEKLVEVRALFRYSYDDFVFDMVGRAGVYRLDSIWFKNHWITEEFINFMGFNDQISVEQIIEFCLDWHSENAARRFEGYDG